jgi:beta-N-acetylhexosaminidase
MTRTFVYESSRVYWLLVQFAVRREPPIPSPGVPRATQIRRRRAAVLAVAAAAFTFGLARGATHEEPPTVQPPPSTTAQEDVPVAPTASPEPDAVDELTLQEQVGKLVVLRFNGTTAPTYVRTILKKGQAAGAILFKDNVTDPQQLKRLTKQLRQGAPETPIVCTDQEGGVIRNIPWAPPSSAQADQLANKDARQAAKALKAEGINVSLAPVADVPSVDNAAMGTRAFSRDPKQAASKTKAAVQGWIEGGVAPTAKHFPGLGGTTVNTDRGSTSIPKAPTSADLEPFKAAIAARVPLIMSSHARYPALDPQRIASQSSSVLTTLLREQLHFEGVVVTDSIEAAAARATGSTEQIAVRSIRAGNDIVLTTGRGSWIRVYRALMREARSSAAFRKRVKDAAARVLALQRTLS